MKVMLAGIAFALAGYGGDGLFWADVALGAASSLDVSSSWGADELNPVLGRGRFGSRQAVVSVSVTAGVMIAGHMVARKWPAARRIVIYATLGAAGVRGAIASRSVVDRSRVIVYR